MTTPDANAGSPGAAGSATIAWNPLSAADEYFDDGPEDRCCPRCHGVGGDPMDDYCTPCDHCGGEGYEWWK